ncbi:MAG: hypothetical protein ACKVY0_06050 [Prosthecobacter sp.]|uniref:hypothetical protein n=1 Tax=Prosthecobacter sp. TaxID=1965333 RepID=UPI0039006B4D
MNLTCHLRLIAVLCAIICSSCMAPSYSAANRSGRLNPTADKGVVLIYWRKALFNDASNGMEFKIYVNDHLLTQNMRQGRFFSWLAEPGEYSVATRARVTPGAVIGAFYSNSLSALVTGAPTKALFTSRRSHNVLTVAAGQTHYVEMAWPWLAKEQILTEVNAVDGRQRIQSCRWLNRGR